MPEALHRILRRLVIDPFHRMWNHDSRQPSNEMFEKDSKKIQRHSEPGQEIVTRQFINQT